MVATRTRKAAPAAAVEDLTVELPSPRNFGLALSNADLFTRRDGLNGAGVLPNARLRLEGSLLVIEACDTYALISQTFVVDVRPDDGAWPDVERFLTRSDLKTWSTALRRAVVATLRFPAEDQVRLHCDGNVLEGGEAVSPWPNVDQLWPHLRGETMPDRWSFGGPQWARIGKVASLDGDGSIHVDGSDARKPFVIRIGHSINVLQMPVAPQ